MRCSVENHRSRNRGGRASAVGADLDWRSAGPRSTDHQVPMGGGAGLLQIGRARGESYACPGIQRMRERSIAIDPSGRVHVDGGVGQGLLLDVLKTPTTYPEAD